MTGDTVGKVSADYRRRRIKRIKRIIIFLCLFLLMLPTCLSVYLIFRVNSLERQVKDLRGDMELTIVSGSAVTGKEPVPVQETPIPKEGISDL